MKIRDLQEDRQTYRQRETERERTYSLVILAMSNKAYQKSPFTEPM